MCNFISAISFDKKIFNSYKLHKEVYELVREKFSSPSQLTIKAIKRVCDSYKINKNNIHSFNKYSSIEYDARMLTWKGLSEASLSTLEKE
jgi:hypothetical protein